MFLSYVPKRTLANSENGIYFSWEGSQSGNTSTNYAGGNQFDFTTASAITNARVRAYLRDVESSNVKIGLNSTELGAANLGADQARFWSEYTANLLSGSNEISLWSTSADGFTIEGVEVVKGGDIECGIEPYSPDPGHFASQARSLSGTPCSTLYRIKPEHKIKTVPIDISSAGALEQWYEFRDSVAASESFWVDLDGTKNAPGAYAKKVFMKYKTFREEWVGPTYRKFSFTAIEI